MKIEEQENLRDYSGNTPEVSFYINQRALSECPFLIFKDKDDFWKARHYRPREVLDLKLTQLHFGELVKISDDKVQELIEDYKQRLTDLGLSLEDKKQFSKLENKAESQGIK